MSSNYFYCSKFAIWLKSLKNQFALNKKKRYHQHWNTVLFIDIKELKMCSVLLEHNFNLIG